tara:strand:- start:74 stop:766 length:693 start_codon:yes stop_codon:yes gene_type:complete
MATRALIGFLDDDKQLVGTYNHYDGYPDGLGKTLVKHFNDEDAAEKLAATGYISSIDPDSGDIDSKYDQEPYYKVVDADDAYTAGSMIGDAVDYFGGDYGYVWIKELGKWLTLKNNGIAGMARQIEDELGESGMYMVDESEKIEENIMEQGYEAKWAKFLKEGKSMDFDVIKRYIQDDLKMGDVEDVGLDTYIDSLKRDFAQGRDSDYDDYEMEDYVEDFENYIADKRDA